MSIPALSRLAMKPLALAEHANKRQQNLATVSLLIRYALFRCVLLLTGGSYRLASLLSLIGRSTEQLLVPHNTRSVLPY